MLSFLLSIVWSYRIINSPEEDPALFWVEICCENLNKEKSKVLFVGVYFFQKTLNI